MKRNPPLKFLIPCVLLLFATTVQASDVVKPAEKPDAPKAKEETVVTAPSAPNQASTPIPPDIIKGEPARKTNDGFITSEFHGVIQTRYVFTNARGR